MLKDNVAYLDFNKAFDTASYGILWKSWQPTSWKGALFAGLRTSWMAGPRTWC